MGFTIGIIIEAIIAVALVLLIIVVYRQIRSEKAKLNSTETIEEVATQVIPDEMVINFKIQEKTFEEKFNELTKEQHRYFMDTLDYALKKPNAEVQQTKTAVCVKVNKKNILKLTIKHGTTVASFKLENDLVKDYEQTTATPSAIRQKDTEVYITDTASMETAFGMIDLTLKQREKERQEAEERKQSSKRTQNKDPN